MALVIEGMHAGYGSLPVLHDIGFKVDAGEILAVVGANGAGKSTLLRAIEGLISPSEGRVSVKGQDVTNIPTERRASYGLTLVPENRLCFPNLTVRDNLMLGAWSVRRKPDIRDVLDLFPRLESRMHQLAGTLSGGEQQMVAIGRGLMSDPSVIMLDEPSTGLAPMVVVEIMQVLNELKTRGKAILLVEQNVRASFSVADRAVVMQRGLITLRGTPGELIQLPEVRSAYLGDAVPA